MHLIDTDIAVNYLRGDQKTVDLVQSLGEFYTAVATIAELSYGLHNSRDPRKHGQKLLEFIKGTNILGIGLPTSVAFGQIKSHLKKTGRPTNDFDILIASSCIVHDCRLVTGNMRHFEGIPGLKIYGV